jgi:cytochrome c oxidase subunit 3
MIVVVAFLWLLAFGAAFYLARQDIAAKPWLERGLAVGAPQPIDRREPAARAGLIMLLAVVGVLFALLAGAFGMRANDADWILSPAPGLLWFNTGLLFLSSFGLEGAARCSAGGEARKAEGLLLVGAVCAGAFLVGQIAAWRQLAEEGFGVASNPGAAFFYLMTGVHGLHILGGLVALAVTFAQTRGDIVSRTAQLRLRLCAAYWHFLLLVWLGLFALLEGWGGGLITLCSGLTGGH